MTYGTIAPHWGDCNVRRGPGILGAAVRVVLTLVLLLACAGRGAWAQDDPLEFYKGYLAVLAKATSLDELLPYYTKDLADGLRKMPKEMQGNYLKMNVRALSDLEVTKQTVTATRADFQMAAKTPKGTETTGSATLVKERGAWKVDNEAWATSIP